VWGGGFAPTPQPPTPKSPIPNPHSKLFSYYFLSKFKKKYLTKIININL
jgi:hypothetical protein